MAPSVPAKVRIIAIALWSAGADAAEQAQQCPSFEAEMPNTDVSAGSLVASHWAASIDDCCQLCDEASQNGTACDGFAYAHSVCYLKADFQGTYYNWGVVSRLRTSSTACSGFTSAQQDTYLDGDLLEEWYSPDPALCCASCGRKPECQGYVYLVDTCYLKGNVQGTYSTEGAIARVKEGVLTEEGAVVTTAPPPQCHLFEPTALDWDIVGDTLAETWAATSDGCCSACGEMPGCEGFAYSNQWNTCYLKGNFTGLSHNPGVVSRIKSSLAGNCSGFQAAREGQDLAGRTVIDFPSPNPQVCCLVCSRKEDCQGFASFEDRCYLKADVSGTFEKQNCQVILKEGILSEAGGERRLSQVPLMV